MPVETETDSPPLDDKRWKLVESTMRRHGFSPNALIETLHTVQEAFGYLDEDVLKYVAKSLRMPLSKIYGVATFYHHFTLKPQGRHTCVVCTGTACYIKGANEILEELEKEFGVGEGQTTPDGNLSVLTARCFGACGLAPAVTLDGDMFGKVPASEVVKRVKRCCHES